MKGGIKAKIGYVRVSTRSQNLERQLEEMQKIGCDEIYFEKTTGYKGPQPEYDKVMKRLKSGDTLVVMELSRISREAFFLFNLENYLRSNNMNICSITQPHVGLYTKEEKFNYRLTAILAEYEWDITLERTEHGVKSARNRGVKFGRKNIN